MKSNVFTHVVANCILVIAVLVVASVGFWGVTTSVFKTNDNAPVYRGSGLNKVSLMFNVYWGTEYLDDILSIFDKYGFKTTFFVGGSWVAQYPEVLQKIVEHGHEVGNHGYYHKEHGKLSYTDNELEINACGKTVFECVGVDMKLFAPPGGDFSSDTLNAAKNNGYKTIMWSRDTIDWRDKDSGVIFSRATKNTDSGELILMHPTRHTLAALDKIISFYVEKGFSVVPVSENIV
ncbi:MAG: polysaccharide deacetylase family protein [Corallococcus sp.]|nr:polysaccharide deacetylase family protein [Bacillota bacterium]MCM1533543.1 polysaccharide deacetylase family protein [Corallococcus sp.]